MRVRAPRELERKLFALMHRSVKGVIRVWVAALWLFSLGWAGAQPLSPTVAAKPEVLALVSSGYGQRGLDDYVKGLHQVLHEGGIDLDRIHIEYLDLYKNSDLTSRQRLADLLAQKYPSSRVGLVVTLQMPALNFLFAKGHQIAPAAPVMVGLGRALPAYPSTRKIFVQDRKLDFAGTLRRAIELFPETERVLYFAGTGESDQNYLSDAKEQLAPWENRLSIDFLEGLSIDDIAMRAANAAPRTVILTAGIGLDGRGRSFVQRDTAIRLTQNANVPVFALLSGPVGSGPVGGMVSVLEDEGKAMGHAALTWLLREPGDLQPFKVPQALAVPLFDWAQIQRWSGKFNDLPPNAVYLNRPPSLWVQYRAYMISGVLIIFVLLVAVVVLAIQNRRRLRAERKARASQQRYQLLADNMSDVLWIFNLDHSRVDYLSPSVQGLVGYSVAEVTRNPLASGLLPETLANCQTLNEVRMRDHVLHHGEARSYTDTLLLQHSDGSGVWSESVTYYLRNDQGEMVLVGVTRDVTQRTNAQQEISRLALFDPLTHLPNRKQLQDRTRESLEASARHHLAGALLFVDLDHFKTLNDTQGHAMGDQLLQQAAGRLVSCAQSGDTVTRLGGDEFVILLEALHPDLEAAAQVAQAVAERVMVAFRQDFQIQLQEYRVTASVGIALFHGGEVSLDELLQRADLAMYRAKADGRDTFRFFASEMQVAVTARANFEVDLRKAMLRQHFVLYFQPQVLPDGRIISAEALVRWQHPQRGLILPGSFISVVEETGLIHGLGQWVLEAACLQLKDWSQRRATESLLLAVNVSSHQFKRPDFAVLVENILSSTGAPAHRLKLELTESVLVDDVEGTIAKMAQLKRLGVCFSLDDFGTGYSSLLYLKRLPLDQIKIDRAFVQDVLNDPKDAAIARTLLALGQSLGLDVIAEGVETEGQRAFLHSQGCSTFQGYLFSPAITSQAFDTLIAQGGVIVPRSLDVSTTPCA